MNKDEIKKALECCEKYAYCKDCPCHTYCEHELHKGALDLITEQEKEIEQLEQQNEIQCDALQKRSDEIEALVVQHNSDFGYVSQARKDRIKLKEEIEQLKAEIEKRLTCDFVRTAQKQAKIDILNKLKEKAISLSAIETYHICNLVDEMIEELEK